MALDDAGVPHFDDATNDPQTADDAPVSWLLDVAGMIDLPTTE